MRSFGALLALSCCVLACQEEPYTGLVPAALKCQGGTPVRHAASLCVDGDFVFAAAEDGLHVLDARLDPKQMEVGLIGTAEGLVLPLEGVACRDGRVYVTDGAGLSVFDASLAPTLNKRGSVVSENKNFNPALVLGEGRAYAASEAGFVEVYDITDDAAPTLAKAVYYPEPVRLLSHGNKWLAVGFRLGMDAIKLVSTASDELKPLGTVGLGFPTGILARGDHLYLSAETFVHYDLSNPSKPRATAVRNVEVAPGGSAATLAIADDYLFVGGGVAYDIYDPEQIVAETTTPSTKDCPGFAPSLLASSGRSLYVASADEVDVVR